uniref:Glycoside hydrolase family 31 N-terminal domain-containing protein n=1 Tax=Meloidogyne incognita TaxID=6306 RepID=A0A914NGQ0_MELIC
MKIFLTYPLIQLIISLSFVLFCIAVDRSNFKTCEQAAFCKRHRAKANNPVYNIQPDSIKANDSAVEAVLESSVNKLKLILALLEDGKVRMVIDEIDPIRQRFHPTMALDGEPKQQKFSNFEHSGTSASFIANFGEKNSYKIVIEYIPFRVNIFTNDKLILSVNSRQLLKFEHYRNKFGDGAEDGEGFWEETFKGHTDTKPFGSSSIGLDVSFIGYKFLYGLPEHSESFTLKSTTYTDPYRLYNLDVFEYELENGMALYGSIPFAIAHGKARTAGVLWLNAAETWVDVNLATDKTGVLDLFLMLGPRPKDVFRQNAQLTGVFPLPPLFAIAYHQCRWNYNDRADLLGVHSSFDEHDIPLDVLWLDIEHTDGKKYFTWDPVKFSNSLEMIKELEAKKRTLVTVIDPHIKIDDGYYVYNEAKANNFFVKKSDGTSDYEGHCWPGASMWLDFVNPSVREFWAGKFPVDQYQGTTERTYTWNDMNEPSVFSGPEITMHKDARHFNGWEHREVHNIYGFFQSMASFNGQLLRSNKRLRTFLLVRSFFVGSQRYATVWTGDNAAEWSHLKQSIPMLLSISVSGIPSVGADVGGFFKDPDGQLITRWYQAGAFQPFFRAHGHIETKRREPWLFSEREKNAMREAVIKRYILLPYWYTLFYEHTKTGVPPMRPVWSEFPEDEAAFDEEREWMVGSGILVRPVVEPDVQHVSLYLPGIGQTWFDWDTHKMYLSPGAIYTDTPLEKIPVYQRGGTIIPVRERQRRASMLQRNDPITLYIASELDREFANGTIYMDDGESHNYKDKNEYLYWGFVYKKASEYNYAIMSKNLDKNGKFDPDVWVERIIIRGVRYYPRAVHMYYEDYNPEDLEYTHDRDQRLIVIRKPGVYISREWRIDIHV